MITQTVAYNLLLQYYTQFAIFDKYTLLNNTYDRLVIQ